MISDLKSALTSAVDAIYAENIRHLPMSDGFPDPNRNSEDIIAPLRTGERDSVSPSFGRQSGRAVSAAAGGGELRIDRETYPDLILRKDDKIVALDRPGEPVFQIKSVDDRSHLRLICMLEDAR